MIETFDDFADMLFWIETTIDDLVGARDSNEWYSVEITYNSDVKRWRAQIIDNFKRA